MSDFAAVEQMIADYRQSRARGLLAEIGEAVVNQEGYLMFVTEPTSFNEVFAIARTHGLTLNSFSQGRKETDFFANWRRGAECFDIGQHERPLDALLIALKNAVAADDFGPPRITATESILPSAPPDADAKFPEPVNALSIFD